MGPGGPPPGGPYPYPYPPQQGYPQMGPPGPPRKKGSGWIVIVLVILGGFVVFGGIFAALAIAGVRKYISNAKTAEARNSLAVIGRQAASTFAIDRATRSGGAVHRLCASASHPVPESIVQVSGKKYFSSAADWQVDAPHRAGFACLSFSLSQPQYFQYNYRAKGYGAVGDTIDATAQGDLNGDGRTSLFRLTGTVTGDGVLTLSPNLYEKDPTE